MIIESLTGLATWLVGSILELFQGVLIPVNLATVVLDFMKVGVWVLGADVYVIVMSTIVFWLGFKLVAGIVLFIWRLLPLT